MIEPSRVDLDMSFVEDHPKFVGYLESPVENTEYGMLIARSMRFEQPEDYQKEFLEYINTTIMEHFAVHSAFVENKGTPLEYAIVRFATV